MWHVPDKGSPLGCHIRPVNSGDTDLVSSSGPTWQWFMFPAVFFRGVLWWGGGGGGSFNQHDEPCHPLRAHTHALTHVREWAYAEGQWAGCRAIISPNLLGELLTHVEGSFIRPTAAASALCSGSATVSGWREEPTKRRARKGLGAWERGGTDRKKSRKL